MEGTQPLYEQLWITAVSQCPVLPGFTSRRCEPMTSWAVRLRDPPNAPICTKSSPSIRTCTTGTRRREGGRRRGRKPRGRAARRSTGRRKAQRKADHWRRKRFGVSYPSVNLEKSVQKQSTKLLSCLERPLSSKINSKGGNLFPGTGWLNISLCVYLWYSRRCLDRLEISFKMYFFAVGLQTNKTSTFKDSKILFHLIQINTFSSGELALWI